MEPVVLFMEVHSPQNLDLPPLRINRRAARLGIEESPDVKALIETKLLLDPAFIAVVAELLTRTKQMAKEVENAQREDFDLSTLNLAVGTSLVLPPSGLVTQIVSSSPSVNLSSQYWQECSTRILNPEDFKKWVIEERAKTVRQVIAISNDIQNKVSGFESERHREFPILITTTLYVCRECSRIVSAESFHALRCQCGREISTIESVLQVPIRQLGQNMTRFIESNYWLEHGVAHVLRQKNIDTLVGLEVLGHSGVWHEIDVIGESRQLNYRILCECKNSDLKAGDVFTFFGKMSDIGCTRGYMFTTNSEVSLLIFRLARSKNISIVANVMQRPSSELIGELTDI